VHVLEILEHDLCLKKALSLENLLGGHFQCGTKHAVASRSHAFHQDSASILLVCCQFSAVNFPSPHINDHEDIHEQSGTFHSVLQPGGTRRGLTYVLH